jgi:hypothetical protein
MPEADDYDANLTQGNFLQCLNWQDAHFPHLVLTMPIYYSSLQAIHQQTRQLALEQCRHCKQTQQLVSHGFIFKKRVRDEPHPVGKRVFCSNRHKRTGCGRTMQLYLASTLRYLHHAGNAVVTFVLALLANKSIALAYTQATGADSPRHAYRWLQRLSEQISTYRSLFHQPPLAEPGSVAQSRSLRRSLLTSTFTNLLMHFGQPLCQAYQSQLQRPLF